MPSFGPPSYGGSPSGTSLSIPAPTGLASGKYIVIAARSQDSAGTADWTVPAGFERISPAPPSLPNAGARVGGIWRRLITDPLAEPANYVITGPNGRSVGVASVFTPDQIGDLTVVGTTQYGGSSANAGIVTFSAHTISDAPAVTLIALGAECTAGISHVPSEIPAGYTTIGNAQNTLDSSTTGSRTGLWLGFKIESTTSVASVTGGFAGASAPGGYSGSIKGGLAAPPMPIGTPIKLGDGSTAYLSYLDGTSTRRAPSSVSIWTPGFVDVDALLSKPNATMAHRGGSLNWPEFSEVAYDRSVRRGYGLLEFSCGWTSDLTPFGLGSQYLDEAAGVTGNVDPNTMTWNTLTATYQNKLRPVRPGIYQPFYRLEEFLAKYTPQRLVAVDPKFGFATPEKVNAMLDICDAHGGPQKIIIKFDSPTANTVLVDAAKGRGYLTMNYWGTDADKLTPAYGTDRWDLIGVRYDAVQSTYDAALALGKPVWAAVIPDQAGYATSVSRGADLMMCANVAGIAPVGAI